MSPADKGSLGFGESVVVGIDNGGTCNNVTVLDRSGRFLIDEMVEIPSRVREGTSAGLDALEEAFEKALAVTGIPREQVCAIGLDSPGPASSDGVLSVEGSTNFGDPGWRGFDLRGHLEARLALPVIYSNDGNAAALYAHRLHFGEDRLARSSVSAIVGTGLGGGIVQWGRVVEGTSGQAGELGHVSISLEGLLEPGQPVPICNCGLAGDAESVASLTGIERNLLPYFLSRFADHELASVQPLSRAARAIRSYAEAGDPMALAIFGQQAMALGRLFTIAANLLDADAYFVGGGVVETSKAFQEWFLATVRKNTTLRAESAAKAVFGLVPDLDMAGARGAAIAALEAACPS
ncbi:MAG: ROK family protein [Acidimicrobiales bacterium]